MGRSNKQESRIWMDKPLQDAAWRYVNKYVWDVNFETREEDSHIHVTGSVENVAQVEAFCDGWKEAVVFVANQLKGST